nr:MAG TPA: CDI toxin-like protein [Caudoviricetes sp.]
MPDLDSLNRLTDAYDSQVHAIRQQITAFGQAYWDSLPHYRASAVEDMIQAITPRVTAGQLRIADLTRAYLAQCARELGWKVVLPPIDQDEIRGARGVDPRVVYRRPAVDVYTALAAGKPLPPAAAEGRLRLTQLIGGDMQLAKVHASRQSMRGYPAEGQFYRRVLTGRENCALCVVASTQRYYRDDLMPIHPGCDCGVQPLPPGLAVNQVIDEDLLEQVHQITADRLGVSDRGGRTPDYRKLLTVSEHGEYGPTLSWAQPKAKPKTKAGGAEPPKPPKPPKKATAQPPDDSDRLKRLMSVPAEKWHKTLQYEGGDVTGIPGEFKYPTHGDGRVFIPAVSVRDAPGEHEVLTALRLAEEGVDVLFRIDSREEGVKNPDVEMNQQVWELKAPTGQGKNTVDSQMKRAGKQTERLVLDLRRSELDDKKSIRDVRQGMQGRHLTQVIVIDHAGNIVHIP